MKIRLVLPLILLSFAQILTAQAEESFEDFESLLDSASNIATKKSINVDYLPSVVSVIDAETFVAAGIVNVGEALGMLPGIQMQMSTLGQPITTVRGFKTPNSFIADKIKILIDGVAINNEAAGTAGFFMDFPLKLVKRIEVLRGPGSTIYGAGAFYGAVNIITKLGSKEDANQVYLGIGSYEYATLGANFNATVGNYKIYTDAYYSKNDKKLEDKELSEDKRFTDEKMKNSSVGFRVTNGGFEFLTRYKESHYGNFYLRKGDVTPNEDKGHKDIYYLAQASYKTEINDYELTTKLNYSHRESDVTGYFDNNVTNVNNQLSALGLPTNDKAFYVRDHQIEQNVEAQAIVAFPTIASNDITIEVGLRKVYITTNDFYSSIEDVLQNNAPPSAGVIAYLQANEPAYAQNINSKRIFNKTSRTILHANLEDLINISEKIDIVFGIRADNYSDMGLNYSYRAGGVYRATDEVVLKLLYGSAFRVPTFTEAYTEGHIGYRAGDASLKPEHVDTYEASLVFKPNFNNKLTLNTYYSKLSNVIDLEELKATPAGYQNMSARTTKGIEAEYFYKLQNAHDFYLNASYVDAEYIIPIDDSSPTEIKQSMPDISKLMLKALYIYYPTSSLSFGTAWQYYSQTTETQLNWLADDVGYRGVREQNIFDETITYRFLNSSALRLTIKNIFDEEVRLPSYYNSQSGGVLREGRNYYLDYTYNF